MNPGKPQTRFGLSACKPAFTFLLKLLILLILLKCVFVFYNLHSGDGWHISGFQNVILLLGWSMFYDIFIIAILAVPLTFLFFLFKSIRIVLKIVRIVFSAIFSLMVLLNAVDIFYFPFKLQRANAELLYVLRNPFHEVNFTYFLMAIVIIVAFILVAILCYAWIALLNKSSRFRHSELASLILFVIICLLVFISGQKKLAPTYPLVNINYNQLPLVQNSFHQFIYSLFRKNESIIFNEDYIRKLPASTRLNILKTIYNAGNKDSNTIKKNIVLFIMESVSYDFFDSTSKYKVKMPFIDSLIKKSTFFTHSFSYSYNSNKGITAILAGTPTLTEIPLYHSAYTSMPITHVGTVLKDQGYQSAFFIGDNYDDFGFAKCVNWLGIQQYYSMEDVPGYEDMEKHTMGLHDEFVLRFMNDKINEMKQPFFATDFNISTHFPGNVPSTFVEKYPAINTTARMKTMSYYNDCLSEFFSKAKQQPWYKNTVFIFCSDHWMYPDFNDLKNDVEKNFRIATFIFDPQNDSGKIVNTPVSQLDVMNTMLHVSGYNKQFISYGEDLLQKTKDPNRVVYAKTSNVLYEAFDSSYVLGFNVVQGKPEFCYNYVTDTARKNNLIHSAQDKSVIRLIEKMRDFLHTGYMQYESKKVN